MIFQLPAVVTPEATNIKADRTPVKQRYQTYLFYGSLQQVMRAVLSNSNKADLSKRESEVLLLMAEGLTHKQVAEKLFISPNTVRKHLENIYQKLNVNNKIEAVMKLKK